MPKVSVIITLYNGKKYIEKAINSILNQTYKDFETIIIDDGSTDDSGDLVKKKFGSKTIYIYQKNQGIVGALNKGISISNGEFIAFCDQDDYWLPTKLEKQIDFLEKNKDISLVYTDSLMYENDNIKKKTFIQSRRINPCQGGKSKCLREMFWQNFIPAPLTVLIRKSIFNKVGLFNNKFSFAYDYAYWLLLLESDIGVSYIGEPLAIWRDRPEISSKVRESKRMQIRILNDFVKRNPKFIINNPLLVVKKFIKSYGGLILGRTSLKNIVGFKNNNL